MGLKLVLTVAVAILSILAYFLVSRLGFGSAFPSAIYSSLPQLSNAIPEVVATLEYPPGNIAVSSGGRIFFNFHPEFKPQTKIAEFFPTENRWAAFPNISFQNKIVTCLSMRIDSLNRLWLLEYGEHGTATPALYGIHLDNADGTRPDITHTFPRDVAGFGSMLNDFSISPDGEHIYIADTSILGGTPALIVYSVSEGISQQLLRGHPSLTGRSAFLSVNGHSIGFGPLGLRINVDSIALSRDGRALYFSPLTGSDLLCVSTADLHTALAPTLSRSQEDPPLVQVHVVLSDKPATDGITTDLEGNVWMTALEHSSLALATPVSTGGREVCAPMSLHNAISDSDLLRWPDGFSFGPDGLYVTNSALFVKFKNLDMSRAAPFHILRLPPDVLDSITHTATATASSSSSSLAAHNRFSQENLRQLSGQ